MKPRTAESRQIATRSSEVWVAWREIQAQLVDPRGRRAPLTLPAGLGFNEELGCCAVCTSSARRFATCSFSVTNQSFTNVQCFASVGKLNNDMSCLRHPIPSCSCPPAYRVRALSLLHFPNHHSFWEPRVIHTNASPATSILRFRTVVSTFSEPVLASTSASDSM